MQTYGTFHSTSDGSWRCNGAAWARPLFTAVVIWSMCVSVSFNWRLAQPRGHTNQSGLFVNLMEADAMVEQRFPHIILVLLDDQGFADMGYQSQDMASLTPQMNRLAQEGIRLAWYYTMYICSPARGSLLTGRYPTHIGLQYKVPTPHSPWGLPVGLPTLPEILKAKAGYRTHLVGKWHLGFYHQELLPTKRGFDTFYGFLNGKTSYYDHTVEIINSEDPENPFVFRDFMDQNTCVEDERKSQFSLKLYQDRAMEIIQNHDPVEPLFMFYSAQAVHEPLDDPPVELLTSQEQMLALSLEGKARQTVGRLSLLIDKYVGQLVDALAKANMYKDTLLIVASDNGGCPGQGTFQYPLKGGKGYMWEGGIHTNAFIHSGSQNLIPQSARGMAFEGMFHVTDWLPTLLEGVMGIPQSDYNRGTALDGLNQWHALQKTGEISNGPGTEFPREEFLVNIEIKEEVDGLRAAYRLGEFKLVMGEVDQGWWAPGGDFPTDPTVCELLTGSSHETWLFNIASDPEERHNLYNDVSDGILNDLWSRIDDYWDSMVPSAAKCKEQSALTYWAKHGSYLLPWHDDLIPSDYETHLFSL